MLQKFSIIATLCVLTGFQGQNSAKYESLCTLANPDTSVSRIKLRDFNSVPTVLGTNANLKGDSTYYIYSKHKTQVLALSVHAGDGYNQVSIFEVKYSGKEKSSFRPLTVDNFRTEKGIHLGISKQLLIKTFGKCYTSDLKNNVLSITYRIEDGQDSKTRLLARHNMPIYYATYDFKGDKLIRFEFGFEYP